MLTGAALASDSGARTPDAGDVNLLLPPVVYAVAGREMSVYFANLFPVDLPADWTVRVEAGIGRQFQDRWTLKAEAKETGEHPFALSVHDRRGREMARAATVVRVAPAPAGNGRRIRILLVGASIVDGGSFPLELRRLLVEAGFDPVFIGSHTGGGRADDPDGVRREGYGGWRWETFLSRWETPETDYRSRSKFLREENGRAVPDLEGFFARYGGGEPPDVVIFLLGVNDIASAKPATRDRDIAASLASMEKLLALFRSAAPKALLGVSLLPPPAPSQDAFGLNYGLSINRSDYRAAQHGWVAAVIAAHAGLSDMSVIPVFSGLDCVNGYPRKEAPVFEGSTVTARRYTNAVHPDENGHRQIAQTFYAWLINHMEP